MRSFCKKIGVDPGQFSRVLHGKQTLSVRLASQIAYQIFPKTREREYFVTLVELAQNKKPQMQEHLILKINRLKSREPLSNVSLESLRVISEWYYLAVLELIDTQTFKANPTWIAGQLGITAFQAQMALDALLTLGLIKKINHKIERVHSKYSTPTGISNLELRRINQQLIQKAIEALHEQPIENRYVVGKTFALRKKDLPEVQEIIERFRADLGQYLVDATSTKDSVYQLNVQLIELTKTFKKEGKK